MTASAASQAPFNPPTKATATLNQRVGADEGWRNPGAGFIVLFALALVGVNGALLADSILSVALKAAQLAPDNAAGALALVTGVGGFVALISYPLVGRISDRTTGRLGRRRPYLLGAAVLIAAGSLLLAYAPNIAILTLGFSIMILSTVAGLVCGAAIVPDQYEPSKRGVPSAVIGLSAPVGALVGLFIAQLFQPDLVMMLLAPAALAFVALIVLSVVLKDRELRRDELPPFNMREFFSTFWVNPFRYGSFGLAWWSRFLIFLGIAAVNAYQAYYLIVWLKMDPATVGSAIFVAGLIPTALALILAPLAGKLSDKLKRRKPFVIASALVFAIGLCMIALVDSYPMFLVAISVVGVGQGIYLAVDFALITQVLPDPDNPAKDLGIMNLANNLPTMILSAVAPLLLTIGATAAAPQHYPSLFVFGMVAAVLGAIVIVPIRKVR